MRSFSSLSLASLNLASLSLALFSLAVDCLSAQRVIPPPTRIFEGPGDTLIPFGANAFRFQQLYDGAAVAPTSATLKNLAFRRGNDKVNQNRTFSSFTLKKITVQMGRTTQWPSSMSAGFEKNITAPMVTVFSGTLVLPSQRTVVGPGSFNIQIKFKQPFVYVRQLDHLLVDITVDGSNTAKNLYYVDKVSGVSGGNTRSFGTKGRLKGSTYLISTTAAGALMPGGEVILEATNFNKVYPVLAVFGLSDTAFGPLKLPFDLKGLGAPGNQLFVSMDFIFPVAIKKMSAFYGGIAKLGVPLTPTIAGSKIFGQGIIIDKASNKLGLVFSSAVQFQIGGRIVAPFQSLYADDSKLSVGKFLHIARGDSTGGLVTRFEGTFR